MNAKYLLVALRVALGWLMFYAGITKVMDPDWSAAGYLTHASSFPGFFASLADSSILPCINFVNEWGLTLLGVSLILGIGVRLSGVLGAVLMLMYYLPVLDFPMAGEHSYIVDEHIIYALVLLYLSSVRAGRTMGLESWFGRTFFSKSSKLPNMIG
jgi:thiosulfate dehydrogenase (quinone) large subunit